MQICQGTVVRTADTWAIVGNDGGVHVTKGTVYGSGLPYMARYIIGWDLDHLAPVHD